MKSTGIVRKMDELGRITIPIEIRRHLKLETRDSLEIFIENDHIVLSKYNNSDIFDGSTEDLIEYKGKNVSRASIRELAELAGFTINN